MSIDTYRPPRTVMEVYEMLPEGTLCEVIENQLYMAPAPNEPHQKLSIGLASAIYYFVERHHLGEVRAAPYGVYLNEKNVFQPDILFISSGNIKGIKNNGFYGSPDLVIEILSPSNAQYDLIQKKKIYERCGVKEFWVIDPMSKEAKGFYLSAKKYIPLATARGKISSKILSHTFSF
ncbi:MAG: Uma2 family endonuclease [Chitinophagales bacterium]